MSKKRKFLLASCLIGIIIATSGTAISCSKPENQNSNPNENIESSVPEGIIDFDESWLK